jgi:shikimate dehydrogenase
LRWLKLAAMRQLALTSLEWITARENLCRVGPAVLQGVAWGKDLVMSEEEQRMLDHLSGATRLFPIIGDPIKYVESPVHLTRTFGARGHDAVCVPMQVPESALDDVMRGLSATANVDGLLVTMPHKHTAMRHCATTAERTTLLEAVSVLRRNPDRTWHGDMLDGLAFVKAQKDQGAQPAGSRVLLLGTGGAGSAIAVALLDEGVQELIVHDIDETRAAELVELLSGHGHDNVTSGPPDPTDCDMVCNATPLGMNEGDPLPVAAESLTSSMFVGDVIAGHGLTPFLAAAEDAGCRTANGGQMVEAVQELMVDFMLGDAIS